MAEEQDIWQEILGERARQDAQWGGPDHDDSHSFPGDWVRFIAHQLAKMNRFDQRLSDDREALVKIAAIAVAAIQAHDRLIGELSEEDRRDQ